MIVQISGNIDNDSVEKLINATNSTEIDDRVIIYISSRGGNYEAMEAMLHLINSTKNKYELVAFGSICSCAFELFFRAKCVKSFAYGCIGMYHQASLNIIINEKGRTEYKEDEAKKKHLESYIALETTNLCNNLNLTKSEILNIKKGNDVWFSNNRMNEILKRYIAQKLNIK